MRRSLSGLSVIEVVIAFGILTIAALGLIAAMTRLMMAQSSSSHQTIARIIAESVLQETALTGSDWVDSGDLGMVQTRQVRVGQNSELVTYSFQASIEKMLPTTGMGKSDSSLADMGTVWQVKVRIWWNQGDAPSGAVEKGTQTLEVTRLTYVET